MKVRHYDSTSGKWIIDGASNASELELTNPQYLDENGDSISIDLGFTKVGNKLSKLELNLAWIYLNGSIGGGGGSGGGTTVEYTFELDLTTFYTSSSSIDISLMIKSGSVKKSFTIIATNTSTNKLIGTWKKYSMSKTTISLTGLSGTTNIELSAYDDNDNYVTPAYIKVVAGAISLSLDSDAPKTIYIDGVSAIPLSFKISNNVNNPAAFTFKMNNVVVDSVTNITESSRTIVESIRPYIFGDTTPTAGTKFYFEAVATTTLDTVALSSNTITFNITVADGNKLTIVTDDISESVPETITDLTTYTQGSQLGFGYLLSYAPTVYSTFNINYTISLISGTTTTLLYSGSISNITKGVSQRFVYSTVGLDPTLNNDYIKIHLEGYAVDAPTNTDAQDTADVYCRIAEGTSNILYANNDEHTLIAAFNNTIGSGFSANTTGTWNYKWPSSGDFVYTGGFNNVTSLKTNGLNFKLTGVNGTTSGFIKDSDGVNSIPATILSGLAYGQVPELATLMPNSDEISSSVFSTGFSLSMTYKADYSTETNEVVCSLGTYTNDSLETGFEVSLDKVVCKIGSLDTTTVKLPLNELLTIDLTISKETNLNVWYFEIFVNGVLSAISRVESYDWKFGLPLTIGCRNNNGVKSLFSSLKLYDLKLYTSAISNVAVVQNFISAKEQALLVKGNVDSSLDSELRTKNLFNTSGECIIWDYDNKDFLAAGNLYNKLVENMSVSTPYPVVMISETSTSATNFELYSEHVFAEGEKTKIMSSKFPISVKYHDLYNTSGLDIITPAGVTNGVEIGLQGTSSLSYMSKNYELYMGDADATGKELLFLPKDDWLPENEFTLKADVMDSAHVNNVVIGEIINGLAKNSNGDSITPFGATPPMTLDNSVWGGDQDKATAIKSKIKHTSEGFPVLLFIKFASGTLKFCGIYNFNLGRYAYHNLGLKVLTDFTKINLSGPTLVTDYTDTYSLYDSTGGTYSMEINNNSSGEGAFQLDDLTVIKFMADHIYDSKDNEDSAYSHLQGFYTLMANMALSSTPRMKYDVASKKYITAGGANYDLDKNSYYNFSLCDKHLNWNNACAYYLLALIFGMVDSMCKNITLRNWGGDIWYPCFYDMDTAFGLNNAGQDTVAYYAHLHRWLNVSSTDTPTTYEIVKNYESGTYEQYFASWWNRIWEILENLGTIDPTTSDRSSLSSLYKYLRTNLFSDPDLFITNYYQAYTDKAGAIMFNYDYKIKYFTKVVSVDSNNNPVDTSDFSQLKFLHGNRVIQVKDWFKKRIYFLDGVYGFSGSTSTLDESVSSPVNSLWNSNKAKGVTSSTRFSTDIAANSRVLFHYSYSGMSGSFWLDSTPIEAVLPMPTGETVISLYANNYITLFSKLKSYLWTGLTNVNIPLLRELDLSGTTGLKSSDFFLGGVFYTSTNSSGTTVETGLKNVRILNLSNVTLDSDAYTLNVSNCTKLLELNISNSSITSVILPTSAILKTYNLSGTNILTLSLSNQSFLTSLDITNCDKLTSITITNCAALKTLTIPSNVKTVTIDSCASFESLLLSYTSVNNSVSPLTTVHIGTCPSMKTIDLSGLNNAGLVIELVGAPNLETLNLNNTLTTNITLASKESFTSLKSLSIANTSIYTLKYDSTDATNYLDLENCVDLLNLYAQNCSELTKIVCADNVNNPIELLSQSFKGCSKLTTLVGCYKLQGTEIFRNCPKLTFGRTEGETTGTNIVIDTNSLYYMFESDSSLTYADFKYIMLLLVNKVTILEAAFKDCTSILGAIWRDIFRLCPNITSMKDAFSGTNLSGTFFSRTSDFSESDNLTWGILDFCRSLVDASTAFAGTSLQWIDNNAFAPIGTTYSSLGTVDNMFRGCVSLTSATDTRANTIVAGNLQSDTFFTNLRNLVSVYPKGVFEGCTKITMDIVNSGDNTLLFHVASSGKKVSILDNSLYTGVKLIGNIGVNVFGGITKDLGDGWYIPTINSIHSPFSASSGTMSLTAMGDIFKNIGADLLLAVRIFSGLTLTNLTIPSTIFSGCSKLNSIEGFFEGLNLTGNYTFPPTDMFKDCVELKNISSLFKDCNNLKLSLVGEGFKNCKLEDVSYAFANTGVYGVIPYRLFFMASETAIKLTITNINDVFLGCWGLGYTSDRTILVGSTLSEKLGTTTSWSNHIIGTKGTPVYYSTSNWAKTTNYDKDTNETITNPDYIANESDRPTDYDTTTPETIDNPDYNPDDLAYDQWKLDGSGHWEYTTADTTTDGKIYSRLLSRYFTDDLKQANAITTNSEYITGTPDLTEFDGKAYLNYMIPADYLRYCASTCSLSDAFTDFSYMENILYSDGTSTDSSIIQSGNWDGIKGRIPPQIFKSLVNNTDLSGVFKNTRFSPYVGLYMTVTSGTNQYVRGYMYPSILLKYNVNVQSLESLFEGTLIVTGTDVPEDLFKYNTKLRSISKLWANCIFSKNKYSSSVTDDNTYTQIPFEKIFKFNTSISNASGLFSINKAVTNNYGLKLIEDTLLKTSYAILNIGNMFYYNTSMVGNVPTFVKSIYPLSNNVSDYLTGCSKANITNASSLEARLIPSAWNQ